VAGDKHDKTEAPTPKKKKDARKDGTVVRSEDLVTWAGVLASSFVLPSLIARTGSALNVVLRDVVAVARNPSAEELPSVVGRSLIGGLGAVLPALVALMVVAIVGNLAQVGFLLTVKPLQPKLSRLNPIQGIKRVFSVKSLWETAATVLKLIIIAAAGWFVVQGRVEDLIGAPGRTVGQSLAQIAEMTLAVLRTVAFAALVLGIADYAVQRRQHYKELKMSKQEIKQEARESEGDPHVKSRQRQLRSQMSRNRMLAAVPLADVVITNPTHLAVALQYDRAAGAPKVLARGGDELAARIREAAAAASVPCVEAKPLARALYAVCRVGEEIPPELYQGVATVLAFLHKLGDQKRPGLRIGLHVPDSWTPQEGELQRVSPARRRVLDRQSEANPEKIVESVGS
jgi:flagellar biosynthetic protein FlhB